MTSSDCPPLGVFRRWAVKTNIFKFVRLKFRGLELPIMHIVLNDGKKMRTPAEPAKKPRPSAGYKVFMLRKVATDTSGASLDAGKAQTNSRENSPPPQL